MPVDLQVVFPTELLDVSAVDEVGVSEDGGRLVRVTGKDFRNVEEVWLNAAVVAPFEVVSPTVLLVTVPSALKTAQVSDVVVYSNRILLADQSVLRFRLGLHPRPVSGLLRLVQQFLMLMLKQPGRDIFDLDSGGGLVAEVGVNYGRSESREMLQNTVLAIDRTKTQLIARQALDSTLTLNERLASATLKSARFSPSLGTMMVEIELRNQAQRAGRANLAL